MTHPSGLDELAVGDRTRSMCLALGVEEDNLMLAGVVADVVVENIGRVACADQTSVAAVVVVDIDPMVMSCLWDKRGENKRASGER